MMERKFTGDRASKLFPTLAYENDQYLFAMDDKTVGFGFISNPLPGSDLKASDRINTILNADWPVNTLIQFNLIAHEDIHPSINRMMESVLPNQELVDVGLKKKFLVDGTGTPIDKYSATTIRDLVLMVTVKLPIAGSLPTDDEAALAEDLRSTLKQGLSSAHLYPVELTNDIFVHMMNVIMNKNDGAFWRTGRRVFAEDDRILSEQMIDVGGSVNVFPDGVSLGEKDEEGSTWVTNLSINKFPRHFPFGMARSYFAEQLSGNRGIRSNFMISLTISIPDSEKTKSDLGRKRQWANHQAYGPMLKFIPVLAEKKHGYDVLYDALDEGDRPVKMHLGMTIFSKSRKESKRTVSEAVSYWSELGFSLVQDRHFNLPLLLNRLPFGADPEAVRDSFRYKTMATRHAVCFLPIFGDWKGTPNPAINLISRGGQLMGIDIFDSPTNYNTCIAAESGAGKSFLANEMITSYLAQGAKVWCIDAGRSYEDICEVAGGEFMAFSKDSNICINPFTLVEDFEEEKDMLASLLGVMAAPSSQLTDFQMTQMKMAISRYWGEKGKETTVDDIAKHLLENEDRRVRDLGHQLYPFTSKGEYGRFTVGQNNVDFNNPFTVIELDDLASKPHLQSVVLLQLIYQVQKEMYLSPRGQKKILIIDEAWMFLSDGAVGDFIETAYRRFRKYGGAAIVITQSVLDLYKSNVGQAIAENSAFMFLLSQNETAINQLEKDQRLAVPPFGYDLIRGVKTEKGRYSEMFIISKVGIGIGRLYVDEYRKLMYSTMAQDVAAIKAYKDQGLVAKDAIKAVLRDRGIGHE